MVLCPQWIEYLGLRIKECTVEYLYSSSVSVPHLENLYFLSTASFCPSRDPGSQREMLPTRVPRRCSMKLKLWLLPCHFGLFISCQKASELRKEELILILMRK